MQDAYAEIEKKFVEELELSPDDIPEALRELYFTEGEGEGEGRDREKSGRTRERSARA